MFVKTLVVGSSQTASPGHPGKKGIWRHINPANVAHIDQDLDKGTFILQYISGFEYEISAADFDAIVKATNPSTRFFG